MNNIYHLEVNDSIDIKVEITNKKSKKAEKIINDIICSLYLHNQMFLIAQMYGQCKGSCEANGFGMYDYEQRYDKHSNVWNVKFKIGSLL